MIIEHRTMDKHQNADSLSRKTEFYERQEQREAVKLEIRDGFSFMDKETYNSLPLTKWPDKSGKPIEDHPELPEERPERTILKKNRGMPMEVMLRSKIVRETLKAKGYDLKQVKAGSAKIGEDVRGLFESLADDRPVVQTNDEDEPEVSILRRDEAAFGEDSLKEKQLDGKDVMQSLVEKIPEEILRRTMVRKKKVTFNEEAEHLGLGQESEEWAT